MKRGHKVVVFNGWLSFCFNCRLVRSRTSKRWHKPCPAYDH